MNPFKKAIQSLLRRIFGPLFFGLAIATLTTACAATMFKRDPMVDVVKALTDVLKAQQIPPTPTPTPSPTPEGSR